MKCFNVHCNESLLPYRVEAYKLDNRSKLRFCGKCLSHRNHLLEWTCLQSNCSAIITIADVRKLYCSINCRNRARCNNYYHSKLKQKAIQRRKPKFCVICKRDVSKDDSYRMKYCQQCRVDFIKRYNDMKCLFCQKPNPKGVKQTMYCSHLCVTMACHIRRGLR
jgi:hypothetical protein